MSNLRPGAAATANGLDLGGASIILALNEGKERMGRSKTNQAPSVKSDFAPKFATNRRCFGILKGATDGTL